MILVQSIGIGSRDHKFDSRGWRKNFFTIGSGSRLLPMSSAVANGAINPICSVLIVLSRGTDEVKKKAIRCMISTNVFLFFFTRHAMMYNLDSEFGGNGDNK